MGVSKFLSGSPRQHFGSLRLSVMSQGKPCYMDAQLICAFLVHIYEPYHHVMRKPVFWVAGQV